MTDDTTAFTDFTTAEAVEEAINRAFANGAVAGYRTLERLVRLGLNCPPDLEEETVRDLTLGRPPRAGVWYYYAPVLLAGVPPGVWEFGAIGEGADYILVESVDRNEYDLARRRIAALVASKSVN